MGGTRRGKRKERNATGTKAVPSYFKKTAKTENVETHPDDSPEEVDNDEEPFVPKTSQKRKSATISLDDLLNDKAESVVTPVLSPEREPYSPVETSPRSLEAAHEEARQEVDYLKQQCEDTLRELEADKEDDEELDLLQSRGLMNETVFCCEPVGLVDISDVKLPSDGFFKDLLEIEAGIEDDLETQLRNIFTRGLLVSGSIARGQTPSSTAKWLFNVITKCKNHKLVEGALDAYSQLIRATATQRAINDSSIWVPQPQDLVQCLYSYGLRTIDDIADEKIGRSVMYQGPLPLNLGPFLQCIALMGEYGLVGDGPKFEELLTQLARLRLDNRVVPFQNDIRQALAAIADGTSTETWEKHVAHIGEALGSVSARGDHTIYVIEALPTASPRIQQLKRMSAKYALASWLPCVSESGASKEAVEDCVNLSKKVGLSKSDRISFFIKLVSMFSKALPTSNAALVTYRGLRTSLAAFDLYIGDFEDIYDKARLQDALGMWLQYLKKLNISLPRAFNMSRNMLRNMASDLRSKYENFTEQDLGDELGTPLKKMSSMHDVAEESDEDLF